MNEIREKFSELRQPAAGTDFTVTFSCGLAQWQGESPQELCEKSRQCSLQRQGRRAQPGYDITMKFSGSDY